MNIAYIQGNALNIPLADGVVQTCVTSPPYWGLRDYGTAKWSGGNEGCDHKPDTKPRIDRPRHGLTGGLDYMQAQEQTYRDVCGKCGAIRIDDQLGLESTPEEYVANMVQVFREVWRVLRDDGTVWLNLGDSYNNNNGFSRNKEGESSWFRDGRIGGAGDKSAIKHDIIKVKDLCGIPWRVAFALQADGWYLRSDIIWHKPNPMPESVRDRPTKSHEYIFLLSKSPRYYYDAEAIKEPQQESSRERLLRGWNGNGDRGYPNGPQNHLKNYMGSFGAIEDTPPTRNRRSVWTVTTKPYSGAHFATFPPDLIEPCIRAGSDSLQCEVCGCQYRIAPNSRNYKYRPMSRELLNRYERRFGKLHTGKIKPQLVLDPFSGSGTTALVSTSHHRRFVGTELSMEYIELARQRTAAVQPVMEGLL